MPPINKPRYRLLLLFLITLLYGCAFGYEDPEGDARGSPKKIDDEQGVSLGYLVNRSKPDTSSSNAPTIDDPDYQEYLEWKEWQEFKRYEEWKREQEAASGADQ